MQIKSRVLPLLKNQNIVAQDAHHGRVVIWSQSMGIHLRTMNLLLVFSSPVRVGADYRIRKNHELYSLYNDVDVVQRIKMQRMRWLGSMVRLDKNAPASKVFQGKVERGKRPTGRSCLKCQHQVLAGLTT